MILTHYPGSFKSSANSGLPVKISAVETVSKWLPVMTDGLSTFPGYLPMIFPAGSSCTFSPASAILCLR